MGPRDIEDVRLVASAAFAELEAAEDVPASRPEHARVRIEHLLGSDPGGCWVGESDGRVVGAAIALLREGLWGLSLLVVAPGHQSAGAGRALLHRATAYGRDAHARVVLSSSDPRAVTAYLGLGLALHPAAAAQGRPHELPLSGAVRPGGAGDAELVAAVDRAVRGAAHGSDIDAHGSDIDALLRTGSRMLVVEERGYAIVGEGAVRLLAARDEEAAKELLRAALAGAEEMRVDWLTSDQQWAFQVCREAGLSIRLGWGALLTDGELGPMAPYLPSGAYL
jgi:GNAT superfamily N-acetyltransferase